MLRGRRHSADGDSYMSRAGSTGASFGPGCSVQISGLAKRTDLNGQRGKVLNFFRDVQRWHVKLAGGRHVTLKLENIERAGARCWLRY